MTMRNDGLMGLFVGISRSGKSTPIKVFIEKTNRLLIWDAKNEYGPVFNLTIIRSLPELLDALRNCKGAGRFAYVPSGYNRKEFDSFCRLAHTWNRQKEAVIVIEELAAVTNAGKAAGYWGVLVNQSLGLGATLLATVQRGQEVDKSIMNNATYLYVCQHNTDDDARYMANKIGVNVSLVPRVPMQFLIWSPSRGLILQGKVEYRADGKLVTANSPSSLKKNAKPVFYRAGPERKKIKPATRIGLFHGLRYR